MRSLWRAAPLGRSACKPSSVFDQSSRKPLTTFSTRKQLPFGLPNGLLWQTACPERRSTFAAPKVAALPPIKPLSSHGNRTRQTGELLAIIKADIEDTCERIKDTRFFQDAMNNEINLDAFYRWLVQDMKFLTGSRLINNKRSNSWEQSSTAEMGKIGRILHEAGYDWVAEETRDEIVVDYLRFQYECAQQSHMKYTVSLYPCHTIFLWVAKEVQANKHQSPSEGNQVLEKWAEYYLNNTKKTTEQIRKLEDTINAEEKDIKELFPLTGPFHPDFKNIALIARKASQHEHNFFGMYGKILSDTPTPLERTRGMH